MENKENLVSVLQELRIDSTEKSKRGLPFISASIISWGGNFMCSLISASDFNEKLTYILQLSSSSSHGLFYFKVNRR